MKLSSPPTFRLLCLLSFLILLIPQGEGSVVKQKKKLIYSIRKSLPEEGGTLKKNSTADLLTSLSSEFRGLRRKCKQGKYKGFRCKRLKFYVWLLNKSKQETNAITPYIDIQANEELESLNNKTFSGSSKELLMPTNLVEKYVYRLMEKWGEPMDLLLFYKYKQFLTSRQLRVKVPKLFELKVSPRFHSSQEGTRSLSTPRIFWDPGFNLKLKLPFFKDELKVAISTGPSFLAGIGAGMVILIIKGMFAPALFGMKYMFYKLFLKDGSPWDMMKMAWGGFSGQEPWESGPPPVEHYEPPMVHNQFDNDMHMQHGPPGHGPPPSGHGYGWNSGSDQNLQFSQLNPILQGLSSSEGRRQQFKSLLTGEGDHQLLHGFSGGGEDSLLLQQDNSLKNSEYIPSTALQAEVENYDPFYSPLLSRIDSIFVHLGYEDEGCRERAVCSIYKFPVKYAPYSNLLSAQLSKHQSELKRPVSKSPKILRYFKYMKAAKDGQGQASCLATYPNCEHDTDSVTNLPMITTFNQLSELMGAEGGTGPS